MIINEQFFLFWAWKAHTHRHAITCKLSSSFLFIQSQLFNNHAVCYLQSKCLSYCPCLLSWSKFSWVQWSCKEKRRCCVLKSWLALNTRETAWLAHKFASLGHESTTLNQSVKTVDSKSSRWLHSSWGGLKLCCYGTGAICFFLLCCVGIQREFKGNHFL